MYRCSSHCKGIVAKKEHKFSQNDHDFNFILWKTAFESDIIPVLCVRQFSISSRHFLHMLCEHGNIRGSAYSSKHTGQVNSSSIASRLNSMWSCCTCCKTFMSITVSITVLQMYTVYTKTGLSLQIDMHNNNMLHCIHYTVRKGGGSVSYTDDNDHWRCHTCMRDRQCDDQSLPLFKITTHTQAAGPVTRIMTQNQTL